MHKLEASSLTKTQDTKWREITSGKKEFFHILTVLNNYYEAKDSQFARSNDSQNFRKNLVKQKENDVSIYIKKFGDYEFLVHAEIHNNQEEKQNDTWVHIDGIAEEKNSLQKNGVTEHPIFHIVGLSDIFHDGSIDSKRNDLPD
ncbi:LIC_13246 family protein [Leptospira sp. GIMC2001]|uniref:LIC_13246 family protein n=1 Tax=Leptospira sp. GIMC2001 TaxID=1513297 RepID=UPI00234AC6A0|nr:hypothetical protein [Leptospira sp. GIMC2001]WCL50205.1 hypothetical protein O4O04_05130 [Leptospira sp. GIMC2001]